MKLTPRSRFHGRSFRDLSDRSLFFSSQLSSTMEYPRKSFTKDRSRLEIYIYIFQSWRFKSVDKSFVRHSKEWKRFSKTLNRHANEGGRVEKEREWMGGKKVVWKMKGAEETRTLIALALMSPSTPLPKDNSPLLPLYRAFIQPTAVSGSRVIRVASPFFFF